jgi:hypothetical protein
MKKYLSIFLLTSLLSTGSFFTNAQCSVCTKTASQMGEKPAKGMNSGILYLMVTPFAIVGIIGYRWWKSNREV